MSQNIVGFQNVRFCYGEVCALKGLNFSFQKKRMTALVGPNGGGKSTILKLLAGLLLPDDGIVFREKGISVGYVAQKLSFDTSFPITVKELVLMGTLKKSLRPFSRYSAEQEKAATASLKRVGLENLQNRSVAQLSGGQIKRAVIARTLVSDADIIALDEPDESLDVDGARDLFGLLAELKTDKTIVIASHRIDTILDITDSAIYVNETAKPYDTPGLLKMELKGGMIL